MKNFLITLFLGWLGVHRFMQKKYITGALWLCTLGLFGIGWTVDIVLALMQLVKGTQPQTTNLNGSSGGDPSQQFIKSFDTIIVGTFANCRLDRTERRQDIIGYVKPKWNLYLKPFEYEGEPAYYVCHPNGLDIGCVPADLAKTLYEQYRDYNFKVTALERIHDEHDNETFKIKIDIHR